MHREDLFGHWLCDLHAHAAEDKDNELADRIANAIGSMAWHVDYHETEL